MAVPFVAAMGSLLATGLWQVTPARATPASPTSPVAPAASPTLDAPAQHVTPGHQRLAVPASSSIVTVDGHHQHQVAHLVASARFDVAGLTWDALTGNPTLQLRARTVSGWSDWSDAGADGAGNGAGGSDAIYTGAATAVEVRVLAPAGAAVRNLHVSLIESTTSAADQRLASTAAAQRTNATLATGSGYTYATMPTVITRAQWGADESLLTHNGASCVTPSYDQTIKAAVVHHTDGTNTYTRAQAPSIVRGIYAFHVMDRGWCDVGYNFLVDKYGDIFQGRHGVLDLPLHGAHATLWNTNTVGISVMMNSQSTDISAAAENALARVMAWKLAGNYVDPNARVYMVNGTYPTILRHGDVMQTSCPGAHITASMPEIRALVTRLMGNWHTPIQQAWQARGGAGGPLGVPHQMEETYAGGRATVFTGGTIVQLPGSTTTRWMDAAMWKRYSALGGAAQLGFPTADQVAGTHAGTALVTLPNGRALVEDAKGAWLTTDELRAAFWNRTAVQDRLGAPVADAVVSATGSSQEFQRGRIDVQHGVATITPTTAWGDQNLDRVADLATVPHGSSNLAFRLTSKGAAGATLPGSALASGTAWIAQVPDVTGDGYSELLSRRADGTLWFQPGLGNGQFGPAVNVGRGWNTMREPILVPATASNGLPALVAIDPSGALVRFTVQPTGALARRTVLATGWQDVQRLATAGDLDGNGTADLLTTDAAGVLALHPVTTSGTLAASVRVGSGWAPASRMWSSGDITGDGRPDLLVSWTDGSVRVYTAGRRSLGRAGDYLASTAGLDLIG